MILFKRGYRITPRRILVLDLLSPIVNSIRKLSPHPHGESPGLLHTPMENRSAITEAIEYALAEVLE
jgi:hypothetical protein